MRKYLPSLLAVLLALALGCPGDPDTDYRAAIKKDLKEKLKLDCLDGMHLESVCPPEGQKGPCIQKCKLDEAK